MCSNSAHPLQSAGNEPVSVQQHLSRCTLIAANSNCTSDALLGTLLPALHNTQSSFKHESLSFPSSHDTASLSLAGDPSGSILGNFFTMRSNVTSCTLLAEMIFTELGGHSNGRERDKRWRRCMRSGNPFKQPL